MPLFSHSFFAMGSDCTVQLFADSPEEFETLALAAEGEVVRIERRYSRYRADSELSRINAVASRGGSVDVDAESAALIDYAKACHMKSDGAFDITSGVLRAAWDFSRACLPNQDVIDALLPRIGLDKVTLRSVDCISPALVAHRLSEAPDGDEPSMVVVHEQLAAGAPDLSIMEDLRRRAHAAAGAADRLDHHGAPGVADGQACLIALEQARLTATRRREQLAAGEGRRLRRDPQIDALVVGDAYCVCESRSAIGSPGAYHAATDVVKGTRLNEDSACLTGPACFRNSRIAATNVPRSLTASASICSLVASGGRR
jgi:hypothetical protein